MGIAPRIYDELPDLYDRLADSPEEGESSSAAPAGRAAVRYAAVVSASLSLYGFYIAFVSTRAFFTFNPFCDSDCRRGIVYGMLLLIPAVWGWWLAIALWRTRVWSRLFGMATFALFALENLTRVDYAGYVFDTSKNVFAYQSLFLVMGLLNLSGLASLSRLPSWNLPERRQEAPARLLENRRKVIAVQVGSAAAIGRVPGGVSRFPRAVAGSCLIGFAVVYRLFDLGFHYDFLGAYSPVDSFLPRWILQSPASTFFLGWLILVGMALLLEGGGVADTKFWKTAAALTDAVLALGASISLVRCAPSLCVTTPRDRVLSVLGVVAVVGLVSTLLVRSDTERAEYLSA